MRLGFLIAFLPVWVFAAGGQWDFSTAGRERTGYISLRGEGARVLYGEMDGVREVRINDPEIRGTAKYGDGVSCYRRTVPAEDYRCVVFLKDRTLGLVD